MALFCPVTLHLLGPGDEDGTRAAVQDLRTERVAAVFSSGEGAEAAVADLAAELLGVAHRADPGLVGLDVSAVRPGGTSGTGAAAALDAIADQFRGEHVLVVGSRSGSDGRVRLHRLEIGDDGWGPLT